MVDHGVHRSVVGGMPDRAIQLVRQLPADDGKPPEKRGVDVGVIEHEPGKGRPRPVRLGNVDAAPLHQFQEHQRVPRFLANLVQVTAAHRGVRAVQRTRQVTDEHGLDPESGFQQMHELVLGQATPGSDRETFEFLDTCEGNPMNASTAPSRSVMKARRRTPVEAGNGCIKSGPESLLIRPEFEMEVAETGERGGIGGYREGLSLQNCPFDCIIVSGHAAALDQFYTKDLAARQHYDVELGLGVPGEIRRQHDEAADARADA